jgi:hypothetical protein
MRDAPIVSIHTSRTPEVRVLDFLLRTDAYRMDICREADEIVACSSVY